ncbi:MAG: ATP-binding protein, partial [Desulfobacteraceae bacterium]|nr:ATP-binding protein [Desulfobacteraceae bacterium]
MKEDPAILNERSLKQIIRTIRLSEGDFSLILANCNYIGLRKKLLEQLKTLSSFDIREIYLPDSVLTIFSFARDILEDELPDAAMVLGLESVKAIDSVLVATNQVREEFRNNFLFPVILWVNDDLLNKFLRIAPDFRSWAGSPFRFEPLHNDLTEALQGTANKLSDGFLKYDESLTVSELESFLKSFLEDAENLVLDYDQELKADLLFLQGKKAQNDNQADSALAFYRESLGCLGQSRKQTQQGVLLYYIAGCCEQNNDLENARLHFRESAKKLSCQKELSARITRDLCRILRKLEDWNELEKVAEKSLENDYFILARTRQKKDEPGTAIENLKSASESGVSESDPELFIEILELLHVLYFEQGEYLEAFRIKQEKYSTEQQFGFRAFIGAGRLKALRYRRIREADITREIWESGRQIDLDRLITRISRTDCKLIVLHGQSGVGKSSILEAGLEPALKQKRIVTRDVLPILVRSYTGWVKNTCLLLGQRSEIPGDWKVADILDELRKNEDQNILTVLIFDQFEEFFFANSEPAERREFYSFLHDSLNIPFVKVILSLREDYLHYLLECERIANLDMLNNDILNKNIRYYVGNFTPEDAKSVIINLTERAQFYLEESLIDRLVQDLAEETGEVRPIEMQVVGSQLQAENITSLEKYKSKQELVAGFLKEVISDCGKENEDVSLMILYLLTDENNTRPLKTRPELANELKNSDFEVKNEQMDLILDILVGSGLVFFVPEKPADRFQIVHDYLVKF